MGARGLAKIEAGSLKEVEQSLLSVRNAYQSGIAPIKQDAESYHVVAFHKFAYLFHRVLTDLLKVETKMTTTELLEMIEGLTSNNFKLGKKIKKKEDQLLMENDKERFQQVKLELEKMIKEKNYYTTIEKNVIKHNLIFELRLFIGKVDEIEFSGNPVEKDDVLKMFRKCDKYVQQLTSTELLNETERESQMGIAKFLARLTEKLTGKKPAESDPGPTSQSSTSHSTPKPSSPQPASPTANQPTPASAAQSRSTQAPQTSTTKPPSQPTSAVAAAVPASQSPSPAQSKPEVASSSTTTSISPSTSSSTSPAASSSTTTSSPSTQPAPPAKEVKPQIPRPSAPQAPEVKQPAQVAAKPEQARPMIPKPTQPPLSEAQVAKIRSIVGEHVKQQAFDALIAFINKAKTKHQPEQIGQVLIKTGWPKNYVEEIITVLKLPANI